MTTHLATTQHALPESCRRSPCSQEPPGIGAGRQQQKRLSWMKEPMSDSAPKASFSSCIVVFAQSDNTSSAGSTEAQGCKSCQQRCQGQKIRRRCAFAALHDLLYAKGSVRFVMAPAIRRIESQRIMQETLPTTARDTPKGIHPRSKLGPYAFPGAAGMRPSQAFWHCPADDLMLVLMSEVRQIKSGSGLYCTGDSIRWDSHGVRKAVQHIKSSAVRKA